MHLFACKCVDRNTSYNMCFCPRLYTPIKLQKQCIQFLSNAVNNMQLVSGDLSNK